MIKSFVLLLAISAILSHELRGTRDDEIFKAFNNFILKNNKSYNSVDEFNLRLAVFKANYLKLVKRLAAKPTSSVKLGVTKFFDLTPEEFRKTYANLKMSDVERLRTNVKLVRHEARDAPESHDWRQKGAVGPVKDQGQCGSCWAFSTVANVEGQYAIKNKKVQQFSEQQLVDCDDNGDQGCNGGLMENAFEYIHNAGGLMLQKDYKYTGRDGSCKFNKAKVAVKVSSFNKLDSNDEVEIANYLYSTGPLSVALNADTLQMYEGGIVDDDESTCDPQGLNHGVTLVGYGNDDGQDYWIVKNSWGTGWGEQGYFRISRGKGTCGINADVSTSIL